MKKLVGAGALYALPMLAFAVADTGLSTLAELIRGVGGIINLLIPLVAALALLYFFWGLAKFILAAGDEGEREKGKSIMIWGIIALFILASVWGLVNFLGDVFDLENTEVTFPGVTIP